MAKSLPATRFYSIIAVAGVMALGYLVRGLALFQ